MKHRRAISALLITVMVASVFAMPILTDDKVNAATKKVKISFNANGGKFTAKKNAKSKIVIKNISKGKKIGTIPTIKRSGYKLKGWYTKKANGKKVTKKTIAKKKATYFARWNANTYTVKFNANGGSVSPASKKIKYNATYGSLPVPTNADKSKLFNGWYTAKTGGKKIISSTKYLSAKNTTIYAQWKNNPSYVVYNRDKLNKINNAIIAIDALNLPFDGTGVGSYLTDDFASLIEGHLSDNGFADHKFDGFNSFTNVLNPSEYADFFISRNIEDREDIATISLFVLPNTIFENYKTMSDKEFVELMGSSMQRRVSCPSSVNGFSPSTDYFKIKVGSNEVCFLWLDLEIMYGIKEPAPGEDVNIVNYSPVKPLSLIFMGSEASVRHFIMNGM